MKKRFFATLLVLILCFCAAMPVFAAEEEKTPCVLDYAQLLTEAEAKALTEKLEAVTKKFSVELAVVTVENCEGESHADYAKSIYIDCGYGIGDNKDGVLLLIDMDEENRGLQIYAKGIGADAVDSSAITEIGDLIAPDLTAGNYADAFNTFAGECEERIDIEINGAPFNLVMNLVISFAIGLIIALIVTGVMKGKLKSVRSQHAAANYVRQGSMNVTESHEFFLYRTVERTEKPKSDSSNSSSGSGESSGGRSF